MYLKPDMFVICKPLKQLSWQIMPRLQQKKNHLKYVTYYIALGTVIHKKNEQNYLGKHYMSFSPLKKQAGNHSGLPKNYQMKKCL